MSEQTSDVAELKRKQKSSSVHHTRKWDEASFFTELEAQRGATEAHVTKQVLKWAREHGLRVTWGTGQKYGSSKLQMEGSGSPQSIALAWTHGSIEIYFGALMTRSPFARADLWQELQRRLNAIPGVNIKDVYKSDRPPVHLHALTTETALQEFLAILEWVISTIQQEQ